MSEYIFRIDGVLYDGETGEALMKPTPIGEIVRCKDCKWFGKIGCAIKVVDETDKPKENDFCSFAERRNDETD